MTLTKL